MTLGNAIEESVLKAIYLGKLNRENAIAPNHGVTVMFAAILAQPKAIASLRIYLCC